jgi:hypothetical protein
VMSNVLPRVSVAYIYHLLYYTIHELSLTSSTQICIAYMNCPDLTRTMLIVLLLHKLLLP